MDIPVNDDGFAFVSRSLQILSELKSDEAGAMIHHISQVLEHYRGQKKDLLERLKQESESGRSQMEKRLAKQLGASINVPLESDPNYQKSKDQMLGQLNRQYSYEGTGLDLLTHSNGH